MYKNATSFISQMMQNILFYYFTDIENKLEELQQELKGYCVGLELLGTILLAKEGINGCLTGSKEATQSFMAQLSSMPEFKDIQFKVTKTHEHGFAKLKVKIRNEIITSHFGDDILKFKGKYIEPEELKEMYKNNDDFVIVDGRNNYESKIGHFKNAITPDVDVFSDSEKMLKDLEPYKDKKIVTYCTGGIRCEKLSALLRKNGFEHTYQLNGGIIRYGLEEGDDFWEGKCFVFDNRIAIDIDPKKQTAPITACEITGEPCSEYHNCRNIDCDKRFIATSKGIELMDGCCSQGCKDTIDADPTKRAKDRPREGCGCLEA
jgi:UPF0176 protein